MDYKICFTCSEKKELSYFCKDKHKKDGLNSNCKKCIKIKRKKINSVRSEKISIKNDLEFESKKKEGFHIIPIEGFKNYLININGDVYSKMRQGGGGFISIFINNGGYKSVSITINSKVKNMLLHRILAIVFIPNPENKPIVDHIDRNRLNNKISNLRWSTVNENNNNVKSEGCIYQTKDKVMLDSGLKIYNYFRVSFTPNGEKKITKRFKNYEDANNYLYNLRKEYPSQINNPIEV